MKKEMIFAFVLVFVLLGTSSVLAEPCKLDISLINQDPYPANPNDYVRLIFQITGINNPECGSIDFELLEQYPLIFDPGYDPKYTIKSGVYERDYRSFFLASYKVRIDEDAMDGSNPLEVRYRHGSRTVNIQKQFDLEVKNTQANFEVFVKDYDKTKNILTFEVLNIADVGIEALVLEIPSQENIVVKNSHRNIVGDLDSNDYTSADFQATPSKGEIKIILHYTDSIGKRRSVEEFVSFEPEYFEGRIEDQNQKGIGSYLIWIVLIGLIVWYFWRRHKKKKALKKRS